MYQPLYGLRNLVEFPGTSMSLDSFLNVIFVIFVLDKYWRFSHIPPDYLIIRAHKSSNLPSANKAPLANMGKYSTWIHWKTLLHIINHKTMYVLWDILSVISTSALFRWCHNSMRQIELVSALLSLCVVISGQQRDLLIYSLLSRKINS